MTSLLQVRDLTVDIPLADDRTLHAIRGIDLEIGAGEIMCLVGESGCGKSMTSFSLMGLLPPQARRHAAEIRFDRTELQALTPRRMADIRGAGMAMIFQEPMTSLNPAYTIGDQMREAFLRHMPGNARMARQRALELLQKVGIAGADKRIGQYPHQLSGGLRQRVMIAMALMCDPKLIIADEPTTALDVTIQAQILRVLLDVRDRFGTAILLITHDLGLVSRIADRVAVMYAGEIVEQGTATQVFNDPRHPYTRALMECVPSPGRARGTPLGTIPGTVPALTRNIDFCAFSNRCRLAHDACMQGRPALRRDGQGRLCRCVLVTDGHGVAS